MYVPEGYREDLLEYAWIVWQCLLVRVVMVIES